MPPIAWIMIVLIIVILALLMFNIGDKLFNRTKLYNHFLKKYSNFNKKREGVEPEDKIDGNRPADEEQKLMDEYMEEMRKGN